MTRTHWMSLLLLALSLTAFQAPAKAAAPNCASYSNTNLMSWPAEDPVWEFCWRRLRDSVPTPNGSSVELFEVHFNGHLVSDRMHMPILNVEYGPGGCGCFRDWFDQEVRFEATGLPCANGYCEVIESPRTICDCAPSDTCDSNPNNACNVDVGSFVGVAAEKGTERLTLTSHAAAGWYRYTVNWHFEIDGTIIPEIGFGATPNGCTDTTHYHHGYYRLDFDISGPDGDQVFVERLPETGIDTDPDADLSGDGAVNFTDLGLMKAAFFGEPGPSGTIPQAEKVLEELGAYVGDVQSWLFKDSETGRGYRLLPGRTDHVLEVTTFDPVPFAKGDYWVLAQNNNELDDNTFGCAADLDEFVNGESTDGEDIVFWYRIGDKHIGLDECHCGRVGPRFEPVGDWSPEVQ